MGLTSPCFLCVPARAESASSSQAEMPRGHTALVKPHILEAHILVRMEVTLSESIRFPANLGCHSNRMSPSAIESRGIEVPGSGETVIIDGEAPWTRVGLPSLPCALCASMRGNLASLGHGCLPHTGVLHWHLALVVGRSVSMVISALWLVWKGQAGD